MGIISPKELLAKKADEEVAKRNKCESEIQRALASANLNIANEATLVLFLGCELVYMVIDILQTAGYHVVDSSYASHRFSDEITVKIKIPPQGE